MGIQQEKSFNQEGNMDAYWEFVRIGNVKWCKYHIEVKMGKIDKSQIHIHKRQNT